MLDGTRNASVMRRRDDFSNSGTATELRSRLNLVTHIVDKDLSMAVNKILVADASPPDLAFIQEILSRAGYTVLTATSGAEAVAKAIDNSPDLIFLNVVMPEMDGYAACRAIQQNESSKSIPIVFVSSETEKADLLLAQMQGAKGWITKPYSPVEIVEQIVAFA